MQQLADISLFESLGSLSCSGRNNPFGVFVVNEWGNSLSSLQPMLQTGRSDEDFKNYAVAYKLAEDLAKLAQKGYEASADWNGAKKYANNPHPDVLKGLTSNGQKLAKELVDIRTKVKALPRTFQKYYMAVYDAFKREKGIGTQSGQVGTSQKGKQEQGGSQNIQKKEQSNVQENREHKGLSQYTLADWREYSLRDLNPDNFMCDDDAWDYYHTAWKLAHQLKDLSRKGHTHEQDWTAAKVAVNKKSLEEYKALSSFAKQLADEYISIHQAKSKLPPHYKAYNRAVWEALRDRDGLSTSVNTHKGQPEAYFSDALHKFATRAAEYIKRIQSLPEETQKQIKMFVSSGGELPASLGPHARTIEGFKKCRKEFSRFDDVSKKQVNQMIQQMK